MAAVDADRITTSRQLAEQVALLAARYPHGIHRLATDAGLSAATVHALINGGTALPRVRTLESFVQACGEDPGPWLAARSRLVAAARAARACASPDPARPRDEPLGRLIAELEELDALSLEVHQAFAAASPSSQAAAPVLPPYLERPGFDDRLRGEVAAAVDGSRLVMVVGGSSAGKTRACWEAVRAELPDWRIWHPLTPERPLAVVEALRSDRIAGRTVIWLNEAQFYLQAPQAGERVAAELQALLADTDRGPVLILGSMWPDFWRTLTAMPHQPSGPDPHWAARTLLGQALEVTAPPAFTPGQLTALAATISSDPRLKTAAERAPGGQITQELAGAPELLRRYQHGGPAERAVLWAAMDARRLGHGLYLPEPLLREAAPGYLDDHTWDQVGGTDWFIPVLDRLTAPHRQLPGPLIQHRPRPGEPSPPVPLYRLADYLEQHGRRERILLYPPAAFWGATAHHVHTPADLITLGGAAEARGRYRQAAHLYRQAADAGSTDALVRLARLRGELGDRAEAERLYRQAAYAGDGGALWRLAVLHAEAGEHAEAERLAQERADAGGTRALWSLAVLHQWRGDRAGAEQLYRQAADAGDTEALEEVAGLREEAGDRAEAERLYQQAADAGGIGGLLHLARLREGAGDRAGAEQLYWQVVDAGDVGALTDLAILREKSGDHAEAERLAQEATDAGDIEALWSLEQLRRPDGDHAGIERLYREAVDAGHIYALADVARLREGAGDRAGAERLYQQVADAGDVGALEELARLREEAGDHAGAERLYRQFLDAGNSNGLWRLARLHERAGDPESAERLRRFGLDAKGEIEAPWE
ncbi:tetratricopeptide repeat protein [Actinomadura sp. KC216]|uniref:SEL1-like repeat protein n=1 Tax=Actinomadura sp. KC216 TaxID=2530370 RepID=UPI00104A69B2|nr:tetratricopeptide repeat protein [Actinomadura sp. KC216]TDB78713.1 tetratricopeptide repeat protein [Actinomadura sp. KC216]